jgi:hypothetical protein
MGDYTDQCKKVLTPPVNNWGTQATQLGKDLDKINKDLDKLRKNKKPTADEQKKIEDLKKQRKAVCDKIQQAATTLKLDLLKIPLPKLPPPALAALQLTPPKPPDKNLFELPAWVSKVVKDKGIPLGNGVVITGKASFDFKNMKVKSAEVILQFKF